MEEQNKKTERLKNFFFLLFAIVINFIIAVIVYHFTDISMCVVKGSDTMYHIYRGQWLLGEIEKGNIYPIYNPIWYNGVELMRYWTPAAAYLMALCHYIAKNVNGIGIIPGYHGGYAFGGFSIFAGFIYFIGSMNWSIIGILKRRRIVGFIIGILSMIIPTSIYLYYGEGNLPRSLIIAFVPWFLYSISSYIDTKKRRYILYTAISFWSLVMCHVGYAGMVAISFLFFIIVFIIFAFLAERKKIIPSILTLCTLVGAVVAGILVAGIFLYPSLKGGMASNNGSTVQVARLFFQPLLKTLNPVAKYKEGYAYYYYGISLFLLAIFGVLGAKRKQKSIFFTALLIVILTAQIFVNYVTKLPGGQFLWMLRFLPIASIFTLFAFLEWKTLKKWILCLIIFLIAVDSIQMLRIYENTGNLKEPEDSYKEVARNSFVDKAKKLTKNRIALMDSSSATYYLTGMGKSVNQMLGQGWEASSTARQISAVNEAYDYGNYMFMFDRMKELGVDTICFNKSLPAVRPYNGQKLRDAAFKNGYVRFSDNKNYSAYRLRNIKSTFGVISKYDSLAIGRGAIHISSMFPSVETADSEYVDEYSLKKLLSYKSIYLAQFKYKNLEKAEKLIKDASEKGVRIYIIADDMPVNPHTRTTNFLGVEAMNIRFENAYPLIHTESFGNFATKLFDESMTNWSTVYLNRLDKVQGSIRVLGKNLGIMGTKYNKNIHFIGLNLTYFYVTTKDKNVGKLLSLYTKNSFDILPKRKIVPIKVEYLPREIRIKANNNNVNTTIATHDMFEGNFKVSKRLVIVNKGETVIKMHYPYLKQGIAVTVLGIIFLIILVIAPWSMISYSKDDDGIDKKESKEKNN